MITQGTVTLGNLLPASLPPFPSRQFKTCQDQLKTSNEGDDDDDDNDNDNDDDDDEVMKMTTIMIMMTMITK